MSQNAQDIQELSDRISVLKTDLQKWKERGQLSTETLNRVNHLSECGIPQLSSNAR